MCRCHERAAGVAVRAAEDQFAGAVGVVSVSERTFAEMEPLLLSSRMFPEIVSTPLFETETARFPPAIITEAAMECVPLVTLICAVGLPVLVIVRLLVPVSRSAYSRRSCCCW